jgi:hypothetical protein
MTAILTTYNLVWQLKTSPNYQFTKDGVCVNVKRGITIRKVLCGGSVGYCINGKFKSVKALSKELERIPINHCPF